MPIKGRNIKNRLHSTKEHNHFLKMNRYIIINAIKFGGLFMIKFKKTITAIALCISVIGLSTLSYSLPSDWAKEQYFLLGYNEILSEELSDMDKLGNNISREQFAELAIRLYALGANKDLDLIPSVSPFTDTTNEFVAKAYKVGIVNGVSETLFSPKSNVKREEMAVMIYKELKLLGVNTDVSSSTVLSGYTDRGSISSWALDAIKFCVDRGIMSGVSSTEISPSSNATREQAMVMIANIGVKYGWIEDNFNLTTSDYKTVNGFKVPTTKKTDFIIYKPETGTEALRVFHNGIMSFENPFDIDEMATQLLLILDENGSFNYDTAYETVKVFRSGWDETARKFTYKSTIYVKDGKRFSSKPSGSYVEIKSGNSVEINIYK